MTFLSRTALAVRTARYLKPHQVWSRGRRIIRRSWWRLRGRRAPIPTLFRFAAAAPLYIGLPDASGEGPWSAEYRASIARAKDVAEGRFCFLNHPREYQSQPDWDDPRTSRLWRYHLHYFDYVQDLLVWAGAGAGAADGAYAAFRSMADSWIRSNRFIRGDGWHPYTISLRIVNWIHAALGFGPQLAADSAFRQRLMASLYGQAQILESDLETDVRGNHLLENLHALMVAGLVFDGEEPERWFRMARDLLEQELEEQVLPDGGHFERSPGYHLRVLKNCLELSIWLHRNHRTAPERLHDKLHGMLQYLEAILPPSGALPLLKDTAWGTGPSARDLLAAGAVYFEEPPCRGDRDSGLYPLLLFGLRDWRTFQSRPLSRNRRGSVALAASAHYVMRSDDDGDYLILDAGKPCPDYLPAHAHADLLSYELEIGGRRVVVDSGVYEYAEGAWRDYFRSTRAHNTVEVLGTNQSEVWSSFRVARRARPGEVFWSEYEDRVLFQGSHDGYRRLPSPITHTRTVAWIRDRFWLVVDDLRGNGIIPAVSNIHLHPSLSLRGRGESLWEIEGIPFKLWIAVLGADSSSIVSGGMNPSRQGWYSEEFGKVSPNQVLGLHVERSVPTCLGYVIAKRTAPEVDLSAISVGYRVVVNHESVRTILTIPLRGSPVLE